MELKLSISSALLKKAGMAVGAVVLGATALVLVFNGPQRSIDAFRAAIRNHDAAAAEQYVDFDRLFDDIWAQVIAEAQAEALKRPRDPWAAASVTLVQGLGPTIKPVFRQGFLDVIANPDAPVAGKNAKQMAQGRAFLTELSDGKYTLEQKGSIATLHFSSGITLRFERTGRSYGFISQWQLTGMGGLKEAGLFKQ